MIHYFSASMLTLMIASASVPAFADDCMAKLNYVMGNSCKNLEVSLDLTSCGEKTYQKMTVSQCSDESFTGVVHSKKSFTVSGKGVFADGKTTWKSDTVKIETGAKEKVAAAPVPPKATSQVTPPPAPKAIAFKPEQAKAPPQAKADATPGCARVNKVSGNSCETLEVSLDLSACGNISDKKVKIEQCGKESFSGWIQGKKYTYNVSGKSWSAGDKMLWRAEDVAIQIEMSPERIPAQTATKPGDEPATVPATAPVVATPAAEPAPAAPSAPAPSPEKKDEPPMFTFNGDLRQRFEKLTVENPGANKNEKYDQQRLRARVGVKAQPNSDTTIDIRLATGSGGTTTNQTYGQTAKGFRNYDFKLDRASAKWAPIPYAYGIVGRMANQFVAVGENDLIFDADINFDGNLIGFDYKSGSWKAFARGGQFILEETGDSQTSADVKLASAQLGGSWQSEFGLNVALTGTYHEFQGVKDHVAIVGTDFFGNSNASSRYLYDYHLVGYGVELGYKLFLPITLFYETYSNVSVDAEKNAFIYGLKLGKLKDKGDWSVAADFRQLEKDSTLGLMADGESFSGGTNGEGWRVNVSYNITKTMWLSASQFIGKKNIAPGDTTGARDRFILDLNFKF